MIPFLTLIFLTIVLCLFASLLHSKRKQITLVPLYCYLVVLTLLTHNLSDLGFHIIFGNSFYLISSFAFFTPLLFILLMLYLFEGLIEVRRALTLVLGATLVYIVTVFFLSQIVDTAGWVVSSFTNLTYYFWSSMAVVLDIVFFSIAWELLAKLPKIPVFIKLFVVIFGVYSLDSFVFLAGTQLSNPNFINVVWTSIKARFAISLFASIFVTIYTKKTGFLEENRIKPPHVWDIVSLNLDLVSQIQYLQGNVKRLENLQMQLNEAKEIYRLALTASGEGLWDWKIEDKTFWWSAKTYELLGYKDKEIPVSVDSLKMLVHPDDTIGINKIFDLDSKTPIVSNVDIRFKTKSGEYKWFLNSRVLTSFGNKSIRMVGSIIDIDKSKNLAQNLEEKVSEYKSLNDLTISRELKMTEMKKEIADLRAKIDAK